MDQKTQIVIATSVLAGVVLIVLLVNYRKTLTKFILKITKGGVRAELHAKPETTSQEKGVELTRARFKDENEFSASSDARVKAVDLEVGSKNKFKIGGHDAETKRKLK